MTIKTNDILLSTTNLFQVAFRETLKGIMQFLSPAFKSNIIPLFKRQFWQRKPDNEIISPTLPYSSLSPTDDADKDGHYLDALNWALDQRKKLNIKNIALTGPYGSGKSSVLRTLQRKRPDGTTKFLNISLATFSQDKINQESLRDENVKVRHQELLRLIEISILQQIFYNEKNAALPDSRFKKITSYRNAKVRIYAGFFLIWTLSVTAVAYPEPATAFLETYKFPIMFQNVFKWLATSVCALGIGLLTIKSMRTFLTLKLTKLKFKDTEIEIGADKNKSILNHHLDELLYFFEVTEYDIVVIEDLDRFGETEIFTKLREINLLLNNSKQVNKEIVFIYAVRDDMFEDTQRAKFFDFIVPVIPVINVSNAGQKMLEKSSNNKFGWSPDLIRDISLFVHDMRLLHNVVNEYYLYRQKLNPQLNPNHLLAILVYKNLFPDDFSKLSYGKGKLYNALSKRATIIQTRTQDLDARIKALQARQKNVNKEFLKNEKELRLLYVFEYWNQASRISGFSINGNTLTPKAMVETSNFEYLITNKAQYLSPHPNPNYGATQTTFSTTFADVEALVDPDTRYSERLNRITDRQKTVTANNKDAMLALRNELKQVQSMTLKKLLEEPAPANTFDDDENGQLIYIFLRNGYIDEHYADYISIFYEGTLTRADYDFLIGVKQQKPREYNFPLAKKDELILQISDDDFGKPHIFNGNLLDHLLSSGKHVLKMDIILEQLSKKSEISTDFLLYMLENSTALAKLIEKICIIWPAIWSDLTFAGGPLEHYNDKLFENIVAYANQSSFAKIAHTTGFNKYFTDYRIFELGIEDERLKLWINDVMPHFGSLDPLQMTDTLFDFIVDGSFYEINTSTVTTILRNYPLFNQFLFDTANYKAVNESKIAPLIDYINDNIDEYVHHVYLKLPENVDEPTDYLKLLLNHKGLTEKNIVEIIRKTSTRLDNFEEISNNFIAENLLKQNKVVPDWEVVYDCFQRHECTLTDGITTFLNHENNAKILSKGKIKKGDDTEDQKLRTQFMQALIGINLLTDESYRLVTKSLYYSFTGFNTKLSPTKISALVDNGCLTFSSENFLRLKKTGGKHHIRFLGRSKIAFNKQFSEFILEPEDVSDILNAAEFTGNEKLFIANNVDEEIILLGSNSMKSLAEVVINSGTTSLSETLLVKLMLHPTVPADTRVEMFLKFPALRIQNNFIQPFLTGLGYPYDRIAVKGASPTLPNTKLNTALVAALEGDKFISSSAITSKGIRVATFKK